MGEAKIRKALGLSSRQLKAITSLANKGTPLGKSAISQQLIDKATAEGQSVIVISGRGYEHKPDKGLKNGSCNREACQKPGATWFNAGTRAYYCTECAGMINDACMGRTMFEQSRNKPLCVDEAEDALGTEKFVCVRVCSIGEAKFTIRDKEGMKSWLEYNLIDRWGQSLFINGEYKGGGEGYLNEDQNNRVSDYLKQRLEEDMKKPVEHLRRQPEYAGGVDLGTRMRYNDERLYENLAHVTFKG